MNTAAEDNTYGVDETQYEIPGRETPTTPQFQIVDPNNPNPVDPNNPAPAEPTFTMAQWMQMQHTFAPPVAPVTAEPPAVQMTPEQQAAHFKRFNVDDVLLDGFVAAVTPNAEGQLDRARAKTVLESIVTGLRAEHSRAIELYNEAISADVDARLTPLNTFVTTHQREKSWTDFAAAYPQLSNVRPFVEQAASALGGRLPPGTTKEQAFAFVAQQVTNQLATMGVQLPPVGQQQQQRPTPQQPTMMGLPFAPVAAGLPARGGATRNAPQQTNPFFDAETFRA